MDNYNFNEKKARIFFFAIIGSLLFFILIGKYYDNDLNKNHLYTKGKLIEIKGQSRSGSKRIIFQYSINNKKYTGESLFLSDSLDYYEPNIGKSFLLKMHKKHWINSVFSTYKLYIDKPIPGKIYSPENGWKTIPLQIFVNTIHKPLIILNDEEVPYEKLQNIKLEKVKKLTVLNSELSVRKYGENAQNGAVEISLK